MSASTDIVAPGGSRSSGIEARIAWLPITMTPGSPQDRGGRADQMLKLLAAHRPAS